MCTPPKTAGRSRPPQVRRREAATQRRSTVPHEARCRWIDHHGDEWLFTREIETLTVERPGRMESVVIRFPHLPATLEGDGLGGTWILVETSDGQLVHCSVSPVIGPVELPDWAIAAPSRESEAEVRESTPSETSGQSARHDEDDELDGGGAR